MKYREEDSDVETVPIISPSRYFATGLTGVGMAVPADGDSSEQPAINTLKSRRRKIISPNRGFPAIVLTLA
jgi:hypothetical protein